MQVSREAVCWTLAALRPCASCGWPVSVVLTARTNPCLALSNIPHLLPRSYLPCPLRSKCLVAQYCSTACSHADWRTGGHRQVCKALRALRNEDKERAAAAAAQAAAVGAAFEEEL